jgi:hypothetical protein
MRHRWIPAAVVALTAAAAGAFAFTVPAAAALVTSCTGEASDVTVPGDVFVPAGKSCELTNVVINGNTTVRASANLVLHSSTLNGNLTLQADGFVNANQSTSVTGALRLNAAFAAYLENTTVGGNSVVNGPGALYSLGSSLQGVTSTNGETYLESVRLARNLATTGDRLTDVYNTVIQGTVSVSGASVGSVICLSEVDGNTSVSGSGAGDGSVVQVGASAPLTGCGFDVFAANLTVTDNTGPTYVADNVVRGSLVCTGNTSATVGSTARVRGGASGQCATAAAAARAAADAQGDVSDRKAGLLARIGSRVIASDEEAAAGGRVNLVPGR